jgi:hypothetical protein
MERAATTLDKSDRPRLDLGPWDTACNRLVDIILAWPSVVRIMGWPCAVSSWDAAIPDRQGPGTETTHWRMGTRETTCATRWAVVCAIRRPAHDGHNPRRLQMKGSRSSWWQVSRPSRSKPCARTPPCQSSENAYAT